MKTLLWIMLSANVLFFVLCVLIPLIRHLCRLCRASRYVLKRAKRSPRNRYRNTALRNSLRKTNGPRLYV